MLDCHKLGFLHRVFDFEFVNSDVVEVDRERRFGFYRLRKRVETYNLALRNVNSVRFAVNVAIAEVHVDACVGRIERGIRSVCNLTFETFEPERRIFGSLARCVDNGFVGRILVNV